MVACSPVSPLIDKSQFDRLSSDLLRLPREFAHLGAVLFISRGK